MSVERSQTQPAALPPTDHVARALLKRGARDDALTFLRAAVARDPEERACAALLRAIEARPDASVYGPALELDLPLVEAYTRSCMFVEALAVVRGARLDETLPGRRRADMLEELLAPCPEGSDEELREIDAHVRTGGATVALTMLEERLERDAFVPEWARQRHALLTQLLLESPEVAPDSVVERTASGHRSPLGELLAERFGRRDAEGALEAARAYASEHPDDIEARAVAEALGGLVEAMALSGETRVPIGGTQPMHGHTVALFQLRMGNLAEAERLFRRIVLESPLDRGAREKLDALQVVRDVVAGRDSLKATGRRRVDPLNETARDLSALPAPPPPIIEATLTSQARTEPLEAEPTRREPPGQPEELAAPEPLAGEPTVRSESPLSEPELRSPEPTPEREPEPATVEVSLDAVTREVEIGDARRSVGEGDREEAPPRGGRRRVPSSPEILNKVSRRLTAEEGWAPAPSAQTGDWEEVTTEVADHEQQAELLLRQGYAERALETYDILVTMQPGRADLARRRDEIRDLVARGEEPRTSVEVRAPAPEEAELEDEPTIVSRSPFEDAETTADGGGGEDEVQVHRIITIA